MPSRLARRACRLAADAELDRDMRVCVCARLSIVGDRIGAGGRPSALEPDDDDPADASASDDAPPADRDRPIGTETGRRGRTVDVGE